MPATNESSELVAQLLAGESSTAYTNATAHIGVGDSDNAFDPEQTDLQAASNKTYIGMEDTYPDRSGRSIVFRSLFDLTDANYDWEEYGIFNASDGGGIMLVREVESLGTKTNQQRWQFTITVTVEPE